MRIPCLVARGSLALLLVLTLLAVPAMAAPAGPAPGLCAVDATRDTVPNDFPIEACVAADAITLRNDLAVPVEIATGGALGGFTVTQTDQSPAALVARGIINNDRVLLPGDVARIPIASGSGTVQIVGTTGGDVYILSETLSTFFPAGEAVKNIADSATGLVTDLTDAAMTARNCRAGQNWIMQSACDLAYNTTVVLVVGKAIVKGVLSGPSSLIVSALEWTNLVNQQVPSVRKILEGEQKLLVKTTHVEMTDQELMRAELPPDVCWTGTEGWEHASPIRLSGGKGVAREADGSFGGASVLETRVVGRADLDGDGTEEVVLSLQCTGSPPEQCCAGRTSLMSAIAVFTVEGGLDLTKRAPTLMGGATGPGDEFGPATRRIASASLRGSRIVTHEDIVYPEQYTADQVGGDPYRSTTVEYKLNRGGTWTVSRP